MGVDVRKVQPTTSGLARLVVLTDEQATFVNEGDYLVVQVPWGLAALHVTLSRSGVAYDDSTPPQPYGVPVIEGQVICARARPVLTFSADDLLFIECDGASDAAVQSIEGIAV